MDLTLFHSFMLNRWGDELVDVRIGDEPLTCARCNTTALPFVAILQRKAQHNHAGAYCSHCANGADASWIKWLPKPGNETKRRGLGAGTRWRIMGAAGFRCAYCRRHKDQLEPGEYLHVDHIHPVALGGTDAPENLVCACSSCNLGKAAKAGGTSD